MMVKKSFENLECAIIEELQCLLSVWMQGPLSVVSKVGFVETDGMAGIRAGTYTAF
jgi:hypothetical protein